MAEVREHVADGIEEFDNPLPRWWLYGFYLTIAFAVVYSVMYPSLWFWGGTAHWSSAGQFDQQMASGGKSAAQVVAKADPGKVEAYSHDPAMLAEGRSIFQTNCAVCHGEKAEGKIGPSLIDNKWLYGGTAKDITTTISEGRPRGMPTWSKTMPPEKIEKVAAYVLSLRSKTGASASRQSASR